MDLPTTLLRNLLQLSSSAVLDDDALSGSLVTLMEDLQRAVPSFRGLHLRIVDNSHPVSLTAFLPLHDESINTSLRVQFTALGSRFDDVSHVVYYAAKPGAFVDLATDFGYALDTPTTTASTAARSANRTDGDGQDGPSHNEADRLVALDVDLPPSTTRSGLVGLDERSTIHRAIGSLIDQGHHPDGAPAILRQHAAAAGVETHAYAARLLRD